MKKPVKILIIGPFPPPLTGESFCNRILKDALQKDENFQVKYINTAPKNFDEKLGKISVAKLWHNLKNYLKLYQITSVNKIYATIGQTFAGVLKFAPYFLLAKLLNKPVIVHVHGNNLLNQYQKQKGWKKKIFYFVVSLADKGIVLSENLKPNLLAFLPDENIFVLPNFIDRELLSDEKSLIKNKDWSQLKILYLSNLMTQKGIFELLDALAELKQKGIEYSAIIAGNMDKSIEKQIEKKIELLPGVKYAGVVTGERKKEIFLQSNVFILPSYREGQPLSIFEAMATGNIVVSTAHPGITDIFNSEQIRYIDQKSVASIVEALTEIAGSLPRYSKRFLANYKYIAEHFSQEKFIENLKKIIRT